MRPITITAEAEAVIRANTAPGKTFRSNGTRLPNGDFSVPLEESTIARVKAKAFPDETFSDTIIRICALHNGSVQ